MKKAIFSLLTIGLISCGNGNNKSLDTENNKKVTTAVVTTGVPEILPENSKLILNGKGFRNKYFVKVYECGLYLPEKNNNQEEVINSDSAAAVRLKINSILITKDNMDAVVREGFVKATNGNTAKIQSQIDQMMGFFQKHPVTVGNVYDMVYIPGEGVQGYLNEQAWGPIIKCGPEFRHALIGIWLCNNPADAELKTKMLGN
jgi:Chalcone isomerase-like